MDRNAARQTDGDVPAGRTHAPGAPGARPYGVWPGGGWAVGAWPGGWPYGA
ncbi:MAG: hypothetical protein IRY85_23025 [Micromonosporaceae bacterium]|nr:hypothetical protein [Micromonosporaceae bacterium]